MDYTINIVEGPFGILKTEGRPVQVGRFTGAAEVKVSKFSLIKRHNIVQWECAYQAMSGNMTFIFSS